MYDLAYFCSVRRNLIPKEQTLTNILIMGNLLYLVAIILIIAWAIGFIGFSAGGIIHVLLIIAVIAVILRVIKGRQTL